MCRDSVFQASQANTRLSRRIVLAWSRAYNMYTYTRGHVDPDVGFLVRPRTSQVRTSAGKPSLPSVACGEREGFARCPPRHLHPCSSWRG